MIAETTEKVLDQDGVEENFYEDDGADYYYNNALKVNIKSDSGSTKPKGRIPVWKLKLENESEIPEKPKDILDKPNDKHYEKLLKEVDDQIAYHNKSIEELKEKIKKERTGNNPEIAKLQEEKKVLKTDSEPVNQRIKVLETKLAPLRKELDKLKLDKESLAKEVEHFKVEALNNEIKNIQQKLGYSSLSIGEEKKLIERKGRLENQKPKVTRYAEVMKKTQEIYNTNQAEFDELKNLKEKRKVYGDKLKKLNTKLDAFYETKKQNDPAINNLITQKESIREEINKCYDKKKEINKEWDDKYYKYESQQKLLKYIKEAEEKINMLKKKEEKEKKRREKELQDSNVAATDEITTKIEEEVLGYEIWICDWLTTYFNNLAGNTSNTHQDAISTTTTQTNANSKIDEDILKGIIKPVDRQAKEDEFSIGLSGSKSKKKTKAPKLSKREQKVESNNINIDINIIDKIKDVNKQLKDLKLTPPVMKTDIPKFIAQLQDASQHLKVQAQEVKKLRSENENKVTNTGEDVAQRNNNHI